MIENELEINCIGLCQPFPTLIVWPNPDAPKEIQEKFDLICKESRKKWWTSHILVADNSLSVGQWVVASSPKAITLMQVESFTKIGYVKTDSHINFSPRRCDWYSSTSFVDGVPFCLFDIDQAILLIQNSKKKEIHSVLNNLSLFLDSLSPQLQQEAICELNKLCSVKGNE
jgi:hypothetical protein